MPQALIKINGVAGSDTDLPINTLVQLDNQNTGGEVSYLWAILDQPPGTADVLSSTTIQNPTFTPKKEGTYLIKLIVNLALPTEQTNSVVAAIRQLKDRERVPAAGETTEADTSDGWAVANNSNLRTLDSFKADPAIFVAIDVAGGLGAGSIIKINSATTIKVGLPGQEIVPGATVALATSLSDTYQPLAYVIGSVTGGAGPFAANTLFRARFFGMQGPIVGAPVLGADVFLSDTGQLALVAGTFSRKIGTVSSIVGPNFWISFDGTSPPRRIIAESGADMRSQKIVNVLDPTVAQDAATKAYVDAAISVATPSGNVFIPSPVYVNGNASTIVLATTLSGAAFRNSKKFSADRIEFRATAQAGAPTMSIQIFQGASGFTAGALPRIATVTAFAVGAANTNYEAVFTEGSVTFEAGMIFLLFGRDSAAGAITLRSYGNSNYDLFNQNIAANTYPVTFTTALAANVSNATFNPITQGTAATTDVLLVHLLRLA